MKKIETNIERFQYDDDYILEVWEVNSKRGLMWDFWIQKNNTAYKLNMFGWYADQSQAVEPHIYTKEEAIELAVADMEEYIEQYEEDLERDEEALWASLHHD